MLLHPSTSNFRSPVRNYNILIVGGGIAGPALAFFLHRYGMKPVVVERALQLRASGQTVDLRAEGKEIVSRMGIESKVHEKTTQEQGVMIINSAGQSCASFDVNDSNGQSFTKEIEILRGDLVNILYQHTRNDVEYIFGDHPVAIHDRGNQVHVKFASGNTRDFDLVVGADGIHSKTRRLVFDEELPISYADLYTAYFSIPHHESDGNWARWYNAPGGRGIVLRPDNQGKTRVLLNFRSKERGYENLDVAEQKCLLQKLFVDAGFEAPRILNELSNADDFYLDSIGQVKMDHWTQGRVALVGDAGYCPSPITGMGTTLAFVGAYILAGELARNQDYIEAFKQYETLMRPYVTKAQKISPGSVSIATPQTSTGIALRNVLLSFVARPAVSRLITKLTSSKAPEKIVLPDYDAVF